MKIKCKVLLLLLVSFGIQAMAYQIKILNPNDSSDVYVLSDSDCRDRTVISTSSIPPKQFGTETSRTNKLFYGRGCYQLNDVDKTITFMYIAGKLLKVPYNKIQVIDIDTGKSIKQNKFLTDNGRRELATQQEAQTNKLGGATIAPYETQPQPVIKSGRVIGQGFDSEANANFFLYDGACQNSNYSSSYPLYWNAKKADTGDNLGEGCYSFNQQSQQVFLMASTGKTVSLPMSEFQGGGSANKSFFQSFAEGLQRATTYWNNSANETQRNTTNLTPGLTGGNGMNCTPDGRGGYNCR